MDDLEATKDFLIESNENLARLDQEMVELEQRPEDRELIASIFRTIHTIKGTCGFLGFGTLEAITHIAESILSQVREGERELTPAIVSIVLESVDAVKEVLEIIERTGREGDGEYLLLRARLKWACEHQNEEAPPEAADVQIEQLPGSAPEEQHPAPDASTNLASAAQPQIAAMRASESHSESSICIEADVQIGQPPGPGHEEQHAAPEASRHPARDEHQQIAAKPGTSDSIRESTIRVDVGLLDKLMNLVGELVLARNQVLQFTLQQDEPAFSATSQRLNLITSELQESVMKTRMQPIGVVWNKLPRVVRDLAAGCRKQILLEMDGADTELDRTIIEAIKDPLTHIVRNCCDHGIETPEARIRAGKTGQGRLSLRAFHEGGHVNIEIADDGGGIDPARVKHKALQRGLIRAEVAARMSDRDAVQLVFLPGFSTAEQVTSISGRGVGMDVVKTNIEKIGGVVDLVSRHGEGTTVKIKIPLTLAIIPGLVITSGGERFVIPQVALLELVRLEGEAVLKQIERIHGTPVFRRRGNLLPLAFLNEVLRIEAREHESGVINVVVLQAEDHQFGLVVDGISDTQEIVVKPLSKQVKGLECYSGSTIMGDGRVALILDVSGVAHLSGVLGDARGHGSIDSSRETGKQLGEKQSLLLFRAGALERLAVPLNLVARLEEIPKARVEFAGGKRVVQYRGQILSLLSLADHFGGKRISANEEPEMAQVIVFSDGNRRVGLEVDQIIDIVEEQVTVRSTGGSQAGRSTGVLGSAVVGDKVTDFLDLQAIIRLADAQWFDQKSTSTEALTILLADANPFSRGLVRNELEMAGHRVVESGSGAEALDRLAGGGVDLIVSTGALHSALTAPLKNDRTPDGTPVLSLGTESDGWNGEEREQMLASIQKLAAATQSVNNSLASR